MNFKKYSLITGAAGFLGKMHAEALLEQGDNVIITDLKKNSLSRLKKKLADIFIAEFNRQIQNNDFRPQVHIDILEQSLLHLFILLDVFALD